MDVLWHVKQISNGSIQYYKYLEGIIKNRIKMGNEYNICKANNIEPVHFESIKTQITSSGSLFQFAHKTVLEFIEQNKQFFYSQGKAIAHTLLSYESFQDQINKFPIQEESDQIKIFLPNLRKTHFNNYQGQCMLLNSNRIQLYIGQVSKGKKQGFGVLINKKGNRYYGQFRNDRQSGEGTYEMVYPKRIYKGNWKNGILEGYGQAQFQDGAIYKGLFYQGKKNGDGLLTFPDGVVYEGCFQNDLMHGYGCLTSPKGRQISGEWKQGKYQAVKTQRSSRTFSINQLSV